MNIIHILGFVGQDPETKQITDDRSVTNFSVATSESYKDKTTGERVYVSTWHRCVVWGKQGETIAQYFKKGDVIQLSGKIQKRDYDDKDGSKKQAVDILVNNFSFVPKKKDQQGQDAYKPETTSQTAGVKNHAPTFDEGAPLPF